MCRGTGVIVRGYVHTSACVTGHTVAVLLSLFLPAAWLCHIAMDSATFWWGGK